MLKCIFLIVELINGLWMYQLLSFMAMTAVPLPSKTIHNLVDAAVAKKFAKASQSEAPRSDQYMFIDESRSAPTGLLADMDAALRFSHGLNKWFGNSSMIFFPSEAIELTKVNRQRDLEFIQLLELLHKRTITEKDKAFISNLQPPSITQRNTLRHWINKECAHVFAHDNNHTAIHFHARDEYTVSKSTYIPISETTAAKLQEILDSSTNHYLGSFTWCKGMPLIYT
ncbi:hypothetical protein BDK51DRAFT_28395 [Blyttiomyces helicus]|uniref:Uncharacterized protein n=1 Tax=Blyttiomyces helicus TaxID=388810 RepID=A0A4P9WNT1_9FUNG|nr:hypothetical protein BDK51DRAFT_28395 [Blyttiomyces helicus]|eukprot:RKO94799.1 hypothetical protein BDK51DRAFT_28395 [Blyttiomyces helicus]